MGLVATVNIETKSGSNSTAWQRFLPSGPVALLPLSADHSSLVWTVDKSQVRPLLEMSEEAFVKKLNRALTSDVDQNQLVNSVTRSVSQLLGRENTEYQEVPPVVAEVDSVRVHHGDDLDTEISTLAGNINIYCHCNSL